jgi:conjugal transfer pilus assembly protein TrbC
VRAAREKFKTPSDAELATVPIPATPRLDALPTLPRAGPLPQALQSHPRQSAPLLLVFVSLDMPKPSLVRLVEQAEIYQATLVLRGVKSRSIKQTMETVGQLVGTRQVAWMIDPEPFERFQVKVVPTMVWLPEGSHTSATAPPPYVSLTGDVTLQFALSKIGEMMPAYRQRVDAHLQRGVRP